MRAISLTQFGGIDSFEEINLPLPQPATNEVRIKIHYCAINPVDFKIRRGDFGGELPMVLGFDLAGEIDAVGDGVNGFHLGDAVYAYLTGPKSNGAYAEYVCVPQAFVAHKPKTLSFAQAAALPLVSLTAYQAVAKFTPQLTQPILITGAAGGVGSMVYQLLRAQGAKSLWVTATRQTSVHYLKQLGVDENRIIYCQSQDAQIWQQAILNQTAGQRFSACFDLVGGIMKSLCFALIDFDGHIVTIIEEPNGMPINIFNGRESPLFTRNANLHFEFLGAYALFGTPSDWLCYQQQLNAIAELIDQQLITPPQVTDLGRLTVENIRTAHRLQENNQVTGKLVLQAYLQP